MKLTAAQEIAILKELVADLTKRVHELELKNFHSDWNRKLAHAIKKEKD